MIRYLVCRCSPLVVLGLVFNITTLLLLFYSYRVQDKIQTWAYGSGQPVRDNPSNTKDVQTIKTVTATWTATSFATSISVSTVTATATVTSTSSAIAPTAPAKPSGPAFCDICGPGDALCTLYGEHNLARSRVYEGANARFRRVIANALAGKPTKIGVLGGSVTKGHGLPHNHLQNWTVKFHEAWKSLFPKSVTTVINGAVPATGSDYLSMCFGHHIDEDVDLVIVELLINDQRIEQNAYSYEWLIRGLLALPNSPAVVNLHTIGLSFEYITTGGDLHTPIAEYYDSPVISVRNMLVSHILEHSDIDAHYFGVLADGHPDFRHVNAYGHKIMADLLVAYTQRQICAVEKAKVTTPVSFSPDKTIPGTSTLGTIPRLRLFQKYDRETVTGPITPMCQSIRTAKYPLSPIENHGWRKWSHQTQTEKTYLIATEPGSTVKFEVVAALMGRVRITHLRSKTFGLGDAWCWLDDDKSNGKRVVSWWKLDNINIASVAIIAENATPGKHILSCEVMKETSDPGGGHEFRLIAVDAA